MAKKETVEEAIPPQPVVVSQSPSLGRVVIYRSRTGSYSVPATITCTSRSINPAGVEQGNVPPLSSDSHVHLTVMTPGMPGKRAAADDFQITSQYGVSENVAGCYQEWDISPWTAPDEQLQAWESGDYSQQPAGTWAWPPRV